MGNYLYLKAIVLIVGILWSSEGIVGVRFVFDREECFSHKAEYEGDTFHLSFVVIKPDWPGHRVQPVDLLVKGPSGEHIYDVHDKTSDKYEFIVPKKGVYQLCFSNKSPAHQVIDFDVHVRHFAHYDQHAKDEHFTPLMEQLSKLDEALYNIQFEQHFLEAQTEHLDIENKALSSRAIHKAIFESVALVGASILQVYLLQRLFERKLGISRI